MVGRSLALAVIVLGPCGDASPGSTADGSAGDVPAAAAAAFAVRRVTAPPTSAAPRSESRDPRRWAEITAWRGTFTASYTFDSTFVDADMRQEFKVRVSGSGTVLADQMGDDLDAPDWWGHRGQAHISVRDDVRTTAGTGELQQSWSQTSRGSGSVGMGDEFEPGFSVAIDPEAGVYGVGFSPGNLEVERRTDLGNTPNRTERVLYSGFGYGGFVDNQPLPESGTTLSGSVRLRHGATLTWTLTPADQDPFPDAPDGCSFVPAPDEGRVDDLRVPVEATAEGTRMDRGGQARPHASPPLPVSTFCEARGSTAVDDTVEEMLALTARGNGDAALQKYHEAMARLSTPSSDATGETVRQAVRERLALYAGAQVAGLADDETAFVEAGEIYQAWGDRRIEDESVFVDQLLDIAAEAGMLGLFDLADEALRVAGEKTLAVLERVLPSYDPCIATWPETEGIMKILAQLQLLGVPGSAEGALYDRIYGRLDIALRREYGRDVSGDCPAT